MQATMRILVFLAAIVGLALAGFVGFVVHKESQRGHRTAASTRVVGMEPIAVIAVGERVDIDASVPSTGHVVVLFTAEF